MLKWTRAVLICMALVGCATEAQHYAMEILKGVNASQATFYQCLSRVEASARYARLYQKFALSTVKEPFRAPTAAQLTDREKVADTDKFVVLEWYAEGQECQTPFIEDVGRLAPEFEAYFAEALSDQTDIINHFIAENWTFGQANAELSSFKQRLKERQRIMAASLKERLMAWHQEEREQQQETVENVAFAVGFVAMALATRGHASVIHLSNRQSALARTQANLTRAHRGSVLSHTVRIVRCTGLGRSLRCTLR